MYWYDAARDRVPTVEQRQIAALPHVKVRLGNLNSAGQQKGVDAQLREDLEVLARHRAVTDVVLIAGDEDMVPAVEAAQAYGVRVHVWGVEPPYGCNQAERLVWGILRTGGRARGRVPAARTSPRTRPPWTREQPGLASSPTAPTPSQPSASDTRGPRRGTGGHPILSNTGGFPAIRARRSTPRPRPDAGGPGGGREAQKWILTRGRDNIKDLLPGPILPPVIDKELLVDAEKELGLSLRPYQEARGVAADALREWVHREFGISIGKSRG